MDPECIYKIYFFIPPGVHLLDVAGPIQIFYEAKEEGAGIEIHFLGPTVASEQTSSAGLILGSLKKFDSVTLEEKDWLMIPGVDASFFDSDDFYFGMGPFYSWIKAQYRNGAQICSICTGTFFLAQSGLLDHKQATTHWKYFDQLKRQYPAIQVVRDRLFVEDNRILSSAGVASGIDMSLYVLEQLYGPLFATRIAKEVVVYLRRGPADPQLSIFLQYRNHLDQFIHEVQDIISRDLTERHTITSLAMQVHMSARNLSRNFKKVTGITIGQYIEKLRVEKALQLSSQGETMENITTEIGLRSVNQLRNLLKKYQEKTPLVGGILS